MSLTPQERVCVCVCSGLSASVGTRALTQQHEDNEGYKDTSAGQLWTHVLILRTCLHNWITSSRWRHVLSDPVSRPDFRVQVHGDQ